MGSISGLQTNTDKLYAWNQKCKLNLELNTDKCKILHIGRNNPNINYLMNNVELLITNVKRDLGIKNYARYYFYPSH